MKVWKLVIFNLLMAWVMAVSILALSFDAGELKGTLKQTKVTEKSRVQDETLASDHYKKRNLYCVTESDTGGLAQWFRDKDGELVDERPTVFEEGSRFYTFPYGYIIYRLNKNTQTNISNINISPCSILKIYSIYNKYASSLKSDKKIVEYYYKILSLISFASVNLNGSEERMKIAMAAARIITHSNEVNPNSSREVLISSGEKTLNTYYQSYQKNNEGFSNHVFSHYAILQAWRFSQNLRTSSRGYIHMYKIFDLLRDNSFFAELLSKSKNATRNIRLTYRYFTNYSTNDFYEISTI